VRSAARAQRCFPFAGDKSPSNQHLATYDPRGLTEAGASPSSRPRPFRSPHSRQRRNRRGRGRTRRSEDGLFEEGRAQGQKAAARKKEAKAGKKATNPAPATDAGTPRAVSKCAKFLELIRLTQGHEPSRDYENNCLAAPQCPGLPIDRRHEARLKKESAKTEPGDRVYQVRK
jgi:hypothetical protein